MTAFRRTLAKRKTNFQGRRWVFVPYDQLSDAIGPLAVEAPEHIGIVLVENPWKAGRRPYHKQKLALILTNIRHFALEQAERGVAVRHVISRGPYRKALEPLFEELGPMRMMEPAERELRVDLQPLVEAGNLELIPHEGWLTTRDEFEMSDRDGPPWRMDKFYRFIRREKGILMEDGKPVGGKYSFDPENRLPWAGDPPAPSPPTFPTDPIKEEVKKLIQTEFQHHPGRIDLEALPGTAADAEALWSWAKRECLPNFGPYEDAMSTKSRGLFHTRISSIVNIHRLLPDRIINDVVNADLPLPSKEGFIRQVLGWREFVHKVHVTTDGFRHLPTKPPSIAKIPGDGGYSRWRGGPWPSKGRRGDPDGGAEPSLLGDGIPLPTTYWGEESGLACVDCIVSDVWRDGYSHHITRLMVLSNLARLLDISPRELTDWFWVAYTDAYDWVVEPNVLAMGSFAVGELMTTKPYVSGAGYINRMSDYCKACAFDPKVNCPFTSLYWAFLSRHENVLRRNPRLRMPMVSLSKRRANRRRHDRSVFHWMRETLLAGNVLRPENLP
ncbi:MAG: deoxyribodipyrimidine photolyase [Proteobacteria bacterium]|nr:deoxyribodipyrimidine photolyase [Pseudomonadota bacterium]